MAVVLITGGTGMIGSHLTEALLEKGHEVRHLSHSTGKGKGKVPTYRWDPKSGKIDDAALIGITHIVHLAGAGIADKRWTQKRVKELIESRSATVRLLHSRIKALGIPVQALISAAGTGYYGAVTSDHIFRENDPAGNDTIALISKAWEKAVDEWRSTCRTVKLRTPMVLAAESPAMAELSRPVRFGVGAQIGRGDQWLPWVHINDLVRLYIKAIEDPAMEGAYNANTSSEVTNADLMRGIAKALRRPFFLPNIPAWLVRLIAGELSINVLEGSRCANDRVLATGFRFDHTDLQKALNEVFSKGKRDQ